MDDDTPSEWDHITKKHWNGLGLTDPIKRIEVYPVSHLRFLAPIHFPRTNGYSSRLSLK